MEMDFLDKYKHDDDNHSDKGIDVASSQEKIGVGQTPIKMTPNRKLR